jgi:hypothetical protein
MDGLTLEGIDVKMRGESDDDNESMDGEWREKKR